MKEERDDWREHLGSPIPVFTVSLFLGECERSASRGSYISYPPHQALKFHVNSLTPSSTTMRPILRALTPSTRRKLFTQDH